MGAFGLIDGALDDARRLGIRPFLWALLPRAGIAALWFGLASLISTPNVGASLVILIGIITLELSGPYLTRRRPKLPRGFSAWLRSAAVAFVRFGAVLAVGLAPLGLFTVLSVGVERSTQVAFFLVGLPMTLLSAAAAFALAARLGSSPTLAMHRPSVWIGVQEAWVRSGKSLSAHLVALAALWLLELAAAAAATACLGRSTPAEVFGVDWSTLVGSELRTLGLWRLFGAPIAVLASSVWDSVVFGGESRCKSAGPHQN